jgi:hypothetical protein
VRRLLGERRLEPGVHDLRVDRGAGGTRLEPGIYFYWVRADRERSAGASRS